MYKQLIAVHLTSTLLVFAAGNTWPDRVRQAAELDRMGRFSEAAVAYDSLVSEAQTFPVTDARRSDAFNNGASHAHYTGDYVKAEQLYASALKAYKDAGESDPVKLASILSNEAALYRVLARFTEAESTCRHAIEVNPSSSGAWTNLAEIYRVEGKLDDAEAAARKGLELVPASERDGRLQTLAGIVRQRGRFDEALTLYTRALKFQEERHSVSAATSLANIAEIYMRLSDYPNAESAARRALEMWQSAGVRATPAVAATLNNLAQIRKMQGRYVEAEPLYRRALSTWEAAVGKRHPDYAKGLSNLGDFYRAIGNDRAAEDLYHRAAVILSATVGATNTATAEVTARRVEVLNALGRRTDAAHLASSLR